MFLERPHSESEIKQWTAKKLIAADLGLWKLLENSIGQSSITLVIPVKFGKAQSSIII